MQVSPACFAETEKALEIYRRTVMQSGLTDKTKRTYLSHSENFVRWLEGKFEPGSRKQ